MVHEWDMYTIDPRHTGNRETCTSTGEGASAAGHEESRCPKAPADASSSVGRPIRLSEKSLDVFTDSTTLPASRRVAHGNFPGGGGIHSFFSTTFSHCGVSLASGPSFSSAYSPSEASASSDTEMSNCMKQSAIIVGSALSNTKIPTPAKKSAKLVLSALSNTEVDNRREDSARIDASALSDTEIDARTQETKISSHSQYLSKNETFVFSGKELPNWRQDPPEVITENGFTLGKDVTSLMIRNIPRRCTQKALLSEIDNSGFVGCYDFCYLPSIFSTNANFGYAFVNLISPYEAQRFRLIWHRKKMGGKSVKSCVTVSVAKVQGRKQNIRRLFSDTKVIRIANPRFQPAVFEQGVRIDFNSFFSEDETRPIKQIYRDPDSQPTPDTTGDEGAASHAINDIGSSESNRRNAGSACWCKNRHR